jgi:hypothetical protein
VLLYPLLVFGALALLMQREPSAEAHAIEQG